MATTSSPRIPPPRDVWEDNLEFEMCLIRDVVDKFPYVSLDVAFAGPVARPIGNFRSPGDFHYQTVRVNVDSLRVLEVGLSFSDAAGRLHPGPNTWIFHMRFDLDKDMASAEIVDRLSSLSAQAHNNNNNNNNNINNGNNGNNNNNNGNNGNNNGNNGNNNSGVYGSVAQVGAERGPVDWEAHAARGVLPGHLGELLMSSGIVLTDEVRWVCVHSGYEFAFLAKILSERRLPESEQEFYELCRVYFPRVFDVRFCAKSAESLGGVQGNLLEEVEAARAAKGRLCDPLRVMADFFRVRQIMVERDFDDSNILGRLAPLT